MTRSVRLPVTLHRFLGEERAAIAIETAILLPFLAFFYVTTFVYYDAYRRHGLLMKGGYVVGDMISREDEIDADDLDGLRDVFAYISSTGEESWLRVTEVAADEDGNYFVEWSEATGGNLRMRDTYLDRIRYRLPPLAPFDRTLVVESFTRYQPAFNVGLPQRLLKTFNSTRSRYSDRLLFDDGSADLNDNVTGAEDTGF